MLILPATYRMCDAGPGRQVLHRPPGERLLVAHAVHVTELAVNHVRENLHFAVRVLLYGSWEGGGVWGRRYSLPESGSIMTGSIGRTGDDLLGHAPARCCGLLERMGKLGIRLNAWCDV